MRKAPTPEPEPGGITAGAALIFLAALGVSAIVLNSWGDRLAVRAIVGVAWGGYCLFAFGPDLARFVRGRKKKEGPL